MTGFLFVLTSLLWGIGALATTFQAGVTPAAWSVAIRMGAVGLIFLGIGKHKTSSVYLKAGDAPYVILQGFFFFGVAFTSFYESTSRIPSGMSTLVLSASSLLSVMFGRVLLGTPLSFKTIIGSTIGVLGMLVIVWPQLGSLNGKAEGVVWAVIASIATALGTVIGSRNQAKGLSTYSVLGWGALAGSLLCAVWAAIEGSPLILDHSSHYLISLSYLIVGASCLTFLLYFELVRRSGAASASYIFTAVPIVAVVLSAIFEGLSLDRIIVVGGLLILMGNIIVLTPAHRLRRPIRAQSSVTES